MYNNYNRNSKLGENYGEKWQGQTRPLSLG